jgi:hypothetical protein
MAKIGDRYGILIDSRRTTPIPCDAAKGGQAITDNGDYQCFYADPTPNSWLQVLVLNRSSLTPVFNQDFSCPAATEYQHEYAFDRVSAGAACHKTLSDFIAGPASGNLVVASNQPGTDWTQPPVGAAVTLASVGTNHGIGADAVWYNSPDREDLPPVNRGTFSAIGIPGWAPKTALSNSSSPNGPMGAGAMVVDVTVNNQAQYQPTNYVKELATTDTKDAPVTKVLVQKGTPWPDLAQSCDKSTKPTTVAAIAAVGQSADLTADPRSQYYSQPPGYDWTNRILVIRAEQYTATDRYSECEFAWAKTELEKEIHDVITVWDYTTKLGNPISQTQTELWATFTDVLAHLNDTLSSNTIVEDSVLEVVGAILTVVSLTPAALLPAAISGAATAVVGVYKAASFFVSTFGGSPDQSFSSAASRLAVQTVQNLTQQQNEIQIRWRNILVADYGKLTTTAACVAGQTQCPEDTPSWHIGNVDQIQQLSGVLRAGLERNMYETLFPKKYPWLVNIYHLSYGHENWGTPQELADHPGKFCGFTTAFPDGTGTYLMLKGDDNDPWGNSRVYVATNDPPGLDHFTSASTGTFSRMFGPVTGANGWTQGGLGINEVAFFKTYFDTGHEVSRFQSKWPGRSLAWDCDSEPGSK